MTELRLKALRPEEVDAKVWAEFVATRPVDQDPRLPVTLAEMERFATSRLGCTGSGQASC